MMIDLQQIQQASVAERLQLMEFILQSLKQDLHTDLKQENHQAKPFKVRQFSLGQDVQVDRDKIYAERSM